MNFDWDAWLFRAFLFALTVLMITVSVWLALTIFWPHSY